MSGLLFLKGNSCSSKVVRVFPGFSRRIVTTTWPDPGFFKTRQPKVKYFSLPGFFLGSVKNRPELELRPEGEKMVHK